MSTRGAIAFGNAKEWSGVYNHADSYPTGLGAGAWEALKSGLLTKEFIESHPGGWSSFPEICYCHDSYFSERDGSSAKDSPFYRKDAPDGRITNEESDALFIEYVYVVDTDANKLHILKNVQVELNSAWLEGWNGEGYFFKHIKEGGETISVYQNSAYKHVLAVSLDLDGDEPDWDNLITEEE